MTKDDFYRRAEKKGLIPNLYRSIKTPYRLVQGFYDGHSFVIYDPFKRKVDDLPNWGMRSEALWQHIETRPLYSSQTIDTQGR